MDRKRVLVVDDDPALLRGVGRALRTEGYDVLTAENGSAALNVTRHHEPSLIVLDMAMPVMDGRAFLDAYHMAQAAIPVIVITGRELDGAWARPRSIVELVAKPFDVDELVRLVQRELADKPDRATGSSDETAELLRRIAGDRDPASFQELYHRHASTAFGLCLRMVPDRMWAEDTLQEAFLSIWRKAHLYDPGKGSGTRWLLSVVSHQAISQLRREHTVDHNVESLFALPDPADVWADVAATLDHERVVRALADLPAAQRTVVELAYFGGCTQAQVASLLSLPLGTVKGRLRLALDKLRSSLAAKEHGA